MGNIFGTVFQNFFGILMLKDQSCKDAPKIGFGGACINFLLLAVAAALGTFWGNWNFGQLITSIIGGFVGILIAWFVVTFIFWIFAKIFGGKGGFMEHYYALSHLTLWGILMIIPVIGVYLASLGDIWGIVMNVWITKNVHGLSGGKAAAAVLLPYALIIILVFVFAAVVLAALVAAGMSGALGAL